jgi:hypothetical protein
LVTLGKDVFGGRNSLKKIEYCGKLYGLPIAHICPAERQAVIDKAAAELKAKQEADAKAAADKAAAELKAKAEAASKAAASVKKTTITCVKGKLTKKVTAVKPVCPNGYKKKV